MDSNLDDLKLDDLKRVSQYLKYLLINNNKSSNIPGQISFDDLIGHNISSITDIYNMSINDFLITFFDLNQRKGFKKNAIAIDIMEMLKLSMYDYISSAVPRRSVTYVFCDRFKIHQFIEIVDDLYRYTKWKDSVDKIINKLLDLGISLKPLTTESEYKLTK